MRRIIGITVSPYCSKEEVARILIAAGISPEEGRLYQSQVIIATMPELGDLRTGDPIFGWDADFEQSDTRWRVLCRLVGKRGSFTERVEYTEEEVAAADMLMCEPTLTEIRFDRDKPRNKYDYANACPNCGAGKKLIPPYRIQKRKLPTKREVAYTHEGDLLVCGELLDMLSGIAAVDKCLVPVEDLTDRDRLTWKALSRCPTMPPVHPSTPYQADNHEQYTCRHCRRTAWSGSTHYTNDDGIGVCEPPRLTYSLKSVHELCGSWIPHGERFPAVAVTWEENFRPSYPELLVNKKVGQVLREKASKWMRFFPVKFLE